MSYCGQGTTVKHDGVELDAKVLRCKCWTCANCFSQRCKRLVAEAIGGAPNTLITLTTHATTDGSPVVAAKAVNRAWRTIRKRICRKYKLKRIPCMTVMESTANGWPHLHVLARVSWIDQRWLSNQTAELLDAPIVDVRRIDNLGRVAHYVAKYVGKAPHQFGTCKRYYKTLDYEQRHDAKQRHRLEPGQWIERSDKPLNEIVRMWRSVGHYVEILSPERAIARTRTCMELYRETIAHGLDSS